MKVALLFAVALCALFGSSYEAQQCNNPVFEQLNQQIWAFAYLKHPKFFTELTAVCPDASNASSCCDQAIFDIMLIKWKIAFAKAEAVTVAIDVLEDVVNVVVGKINTLEQDVNNAKDLTAQEKQAINTFLSAWQAALEQLIPGLQQNFDNCFSSVLRFWAGIVCKGCDVLWSDWVSAVDSGNLKQIVLNFANQTCTTLIGDCLPFFQPFVNYINDFNSASTQLLNSITDPKVKASLQADIDAVTPFDPPCLNQHDCGQLICYTWLKGFSRNDGVWQQAFAKNNNGRQAEELSAIFSKSLKSAAYAMHEDLAEILRDHEEEKLFSARGSKNTITVSQTYKGTVNPYTVPTGLNTNTDSAASTVTSFWMGWF